MVSTELNDPKAVRVRKFWDTRLGIAFIVVAIVFVVALLAIPTLDPPGAREQASAVGYVRSVGALEAAHRNSKGSWACTWEELAATAPNIKDGSYLNEQAKVFAEREGKMFHYTLVLSRCEPGGENVSGKYTIVAIPEKIQSLSLRAFCSDETGTIWYDKSGSAEACLIRKNPLN